MQAVYQAIQKGLTYEGRDLMAQEKPTERWWVKSSITQSCASLQQSPFCKARRDIPSNDQKIENADID